MSSFPLRPLGVTDIRVSPVALGCWPIAGMTSLDVTDKDSLETLAACRDLGINFLDTAFCYGADGESEKLIARATRTRRQQFVLATKAGIHWGPAGQRVIDGRPERIRWECEQSLRRLGTDYVDLLYLHAPDPKTPLSDSAGAFLELLESGKTRSVGVSNLDVAQMEEFSQVCPLTACQPPYNLLQRQIEADLLPWCRRNGVSVVPYWPLMKGLLAGRLPREHVFAAADGRAKYPMFQGEEWRKNQDFLDHLRGFARQWGRSVAQIAVNWVISQPGITAALCGAKRAKQIRETAGAILWRLSAEQQDQLRQALSQRGLPIVRSAV